jgi:prolipoprotein diacylglyceryltransferase
MRQTLFYIPEYIGNVPVFGVGLLLGIFTAFSIVVLVSLARRRAVGANAWGYLPILALGVGLCFFLPWLCEERGLPIRGYGTLMLVAVVVSTAVAAWRGHRQGVNPDQVLNLVFWGFVPGLIGARLYYVIQYWDQFQRGSIGDTLVAVANVAEGGLVVYGSFIGASIGFLAFIWLNKMPPLATLDLLAPSIALGVGIGRLGCFMNGCCYGGACELPWKVSFPWDSPAHIHQVEHGETFIHGLKLTSPPQDENGEDYARPIIAQVESGSAAERAGLVPGDEITAVNGQVTTWSRGAQRALLDAYKLDLLIKTTDSKHPYFHWVIDDPVADSRLDEDRELSIRRVTITDAEDGASPAVAHVRKGSWASRPEPGSRPGIQPGQKIVSVNGRPVATTADVRRLILDHRRSPWISIQTKDRASPVHWGLDVPRGGPEPIHPTQLYSSISGFLLFLFLLAFASFHRRDGAVWAMLLTLYPIARIMLERIRTDEPAAWAGMTTAENVSLVLLACAVALWLYILRRPPATALATDGKTTVKR